MAELSYCNPYPEVVPLTVRLNRDGCCVPCAWSVVFDCDFRKSEEYLRKFEYGVNGKGMTRKNIVRAFDNVKKYPVAVGSYSAQNRVTINQFVKKHPKGRYLCLVRGHAIAIIDGVLYDHKEKPRRQIQAAWRVYLTNEELNTARQGVK